MTDSVAADGQTPMTGDLDLNNNKIVNLAPAAFAGEAVEYSQLVAATTVVAITGGTINGTTVGATTPASGRFTTLESTGNTTVGGNLAVTGTSTFTGLGSFNGTGALKIPAGTTAEQPTPVTGQIRFNSTDNRFEGYSASAWVGLGSSAGGSNTQVQYNNSGALAGSSNLTFNGTTLTALTLSTQTITNGTVSTSSANVIQGSAKAWVNFNGQGTVAIRDSYNVSSITDNGIGDYTVNFTTAMANANYASAGTSQVSSGAIGVVCENIINPTKTTTAYRIATMNTVNQSVTDLSVVSLAIFSA
jgi:hypothetical protein